MTLDALQQAVLDAAIAHINDEHSRRYIKDVMDGSASDPTFLVLADAVDALERGPVPDVWGLLNAAHADVQSSGLAAKILVALEWRRNNPDD